MQLTEAEAAFCIQKTGLQLRPIWHQKQERVEAHILVCFLAYEPRKVFEELADITLVDVVLPTRSGSTFGRVVTESSTTRRPTRRVFQIELARPQG